jgi:cell wall-associated NlpC family hydrolase
MPLHHSTPLFAAILAAALLGGCSTTPPRYGSTPSYSGVDVPSRVSPEQSTDVTIYAMGLVGTPYRYGGNTPDSGFDCSGLIGHVYRTRAGVAPPRTVAQLQDWGQLVPNQSIRTGDLVLFSPRTQATHAGIYVGNGRFVHAPSTGGVVRLDRLDSSYWSRQQIAFRRP